MVVGGGVVCELVYEYTSTTPSFAPIVLTHLPFICLTSAHLPICRPSAAHLPSIRPSAPPPLPQAERDAGFGECAVAVWLEELLLDETQFDEARRLHLLQVKRGLVISCHQLSSVVISCHQLSSL